MRRTVSKYGSKGIKMLEYHDDDCFSVPGLDVSIRYTTATKPTTKRDEQNAIYSLRDDIDWDRIERENRRYNKLSSQVRGNA
jgi:hypothetical protein